MATFTVKRWKQFETDDSSIKLVPPEHHPYAWLAPRWWYKGDRTIYETCAQVSTDTHQVYIDGYTPAMEVEISIDGNGEIDIPYHKDIRRIAITQAYGELFKEDGEYVDIDIEWKRDEWRIVKNTLPPSVPIDNVVEWIANPTYMISGNEGSSPVAVLGEPFPARDGDWIGGNPSLSGTQPWIRYRWQIRDTAGVISNSGWTTTEPLAIHSTERLQVEDWWPADYKEMRLQDQVRDYQPGTDTARPNNRFASPWVPIEQAPPFNGSGNATLDGTFQVGETVIVTSVPTFTGGIKPIVYEYQFQKSETGTGSWTGFDGPWQEYDPSLISIDNWITFNSDSVSHTDVPSLLLTSVTENQFIRLQVRATDFNDARVTRAGVVYGPVAPA